jgi:hypothetical protein
MASDVATSNSISVLRIHSLRFSRRKRQRFLSQARHPGHRSLVAERRRALHPH